MLSRVGVGTITKLNAEPWPFARVRFDLLNNVREGSSLAHTQSFVVKADINGVIENSFVVGGFYRMTLQNERTYEFMVSEGSGIFYLWDAVMPLAVDETMPRSEDFNVSNSSLVGTSVTIVHGLASTNLDVTVRDASGNIILLPSRILSASSIVIDFEGLTPLQETYTVLLEA